MTIVALPYSPVDGDPEDISEIMANLNAILAVVNGGLQNDNCAADMALLASKIVLDTDVTLAANSDTIISSQKAVKAYANEAWINAPNTAVYVSATSFKEVGVDTRSCYPVGCKWSCTDAAATKYFYSSATPTYAGGDTTVTITGGSTYSLSGGAITNPRYSYMATPQGFPGTFDYDPPYAGWAATPARDCSFGIADRQLTLWFLINGTSNNATTTIDLPIAASASLANSIGIPCRILDDGASSWSITPGMVVPTAGSATLTFSRNLTGAALTAANNKRVAGSITVPI